MNVAAPESPARTMPDVPPVPLSYASHVPPVRPARRLWAALAALAAGVVVLGIALYALLSLTATLTAPQAAAYSRDAWAIIPALLGMFAGVCTLMAVVFLFVGLRWLGAVSRAVA